ncbi:MAG: L-lactate dehydrogenase [Clostridiales bacterium]|nr:L-lactate dehydrogenase [Clostridiales bacterium]MCF8023344.1 L-lactate dehydrogenase [Clostridiales bacterium]
MPYNLRKIGIIGVGSVGASIAYALMISGLASEMVLVDLNKERVEGEAMDLSHGASFIKPIKIYAGDYEDCHDADIIIFTAGANQEDGETRLDLVNKNYKVLQSSLPELMPKDSKSILLMVSNPVDILTYAAIQITGVSPNRVIGSGTVLDSSRFRYLIGDYCNVEPRNVHAYVIGEHGDSEVLLWSKANIAGITIDGYCRYRGLPLINKDEISNRVKEAAYEVIKRKGATYYAIGLGVRKICESILRNENSFLTVSGLLSGEYGISNVCMSLPAIINRNGRVQAFPIRVSQAEKEALHNSAQVLGSINEKIGFTGVDITREPPVWLFNKNDFCPDRPQLQ